MPTIERFEDLIAWQKGRALSQAIYRVTRQGEFVGDFSLRDQLRRAAVSVPSNIAEGFERAGNKEFIQFLSIAKGSAGEVRTQLYVALDAEYITVQDFHRLLRLATEVSNLINGLLTYLTCSELQGSKKKKSINVEHRTKTGTL